LIYNAGARVLIHDAKLYQFFGKTSKKTITVFLAFHLLDELKLV